MNALAHDIRYALRACLRAPGFTAAAVLSLALGIGANTAIFSVASALLLHPLPYADPDRLVILWNRSPGLGITEDWFSTAQYFDIRTRHRGFDQVAIAIGANFNLTGDGAPERVGTIRVSSNLLPMLGVRPEAGRLFGEDDDVAGAAGTAILGYGTWMRRYGGDRSAIGRTIVLNGQSYRIVGVLPSSFSLPREVMPTLNGAEDAEVVLPLPMAPNAAQIRVREDYNILAKLKPGVSVPAAQAEMDALTASLRAEHPDVYPPNGGLTFSIVPLREQVVGHARRSIVVLVAAVGCLLLVACANVANLLLSRALARSKEIAVRAVLGAGTARIVRQLLTESVLLALGGGAAGLLLSHLGVRAIQSLGAGSVPRASEIAINGEVLLFAVLLSTASGMIFGLAPALRVSRIDLNDQLKDVSRAASGGSAVWGRGRNLRRALVAAELALSVMLLIGSGLLIRSFARLQDVNPGFNAAQTMTVELTLSGTKYTDVSRMLETYRELWARLGRIPGVTAAGGVSALPLSQMMSWGPVTVEGRVPPPGEKFVNADMRMVGGDYFRAMEIPLLGGRIFNEQDTRTNPRVAVIDSYMAEQLWPGQDPIGRRLKLGGLDSTSPWVTIVGMVGRIRQDALDSESRIALYLPQTQYPTRAMNIVVRGRGDAESLTPAIRQQISEIDPDLPMYGVRTMDDRVDASLARRRFSMLLLTLFACLALGIASVGVYGVIAYLVSQGVREIGIRLALGATPRRILGMIVGQGMRVALTGVAVGLAGSLVLTRFMRGLLFGVGERDPLTFVVTPALLAAVALAATYIPARRAARIDPIESLRRE